MRKFGHLGWFGGVLISLALVLNSLSGFVHAADVPEYRIQVSPVRFELDLKPGKTTTETFRVQNTGSKEFSYTVSVAPYNVISDDYEADFSSETQYNDIVKWVTFSQTSGTLEPRGEDEITVTVRVPSNAPEGGQYAAIMASMDASDTAGGTGVAIVRQVGILLYSANVEGRTVKTASVEENKIPSFIFNPPITVTSLVKNTGNVHAEASYTLQVFPLFSDEEAFTNEEDPIKQMVLPGTNRYNELSWDGAPALGIFRVKQTVKIFDEVSTTEKLVFLCPIWFLFIVLLLIFCVIFWVVSRVRNRRKEA